MLITGKALGTRKPLFADWHISLPEEIGSEPVTLRQLIEHIVRDQITQFQQRQYDRQFLRVLNAAEIEQAAERGKIAMGESEVGIQAVDVDQAIASALQAFEDGIYLVVLDEVEQQSLDQQVFVHPDSRIVFIRLVMLAGG